MQKSNWTLKPGERLHGGDLLEELLQDYLEEQHDKHLIILTEDSSTIYFVELDETSNIIGADVALFYNESYCFLPEDMAKNLAEAHMLHISLLSKAHEYLEASLED